MRILLPIVLLIIIGASCTKEEVIDFREGMTFDPDTVSFETFEEGWVLFSWQANDIWRYSLMPDTTPRYSSQQILANPFAVNNREQFKMLLRRMPSGEVITWYGVEWVQNNVAGVTFFFKMPPLLEQYDIYSFSDRNGLDMIVIDE